MLMFSLSLFQACSCGNVGSEEDARLAYFGIDPGIARMLKLGFDGFNTASSANIDTQTESGGLQGEMRVGGQVDQGSSANKGMRLDVSLVDYADIFPEAGDRDDIDRIVYDTKDGSSLSVDLNLRGIPDGTLQGTLSGTVEMSESLSGPLLMNLSFAGDIKEDPDHAGQTVRSEGTIKVTGTAESDFGVYNVDLTR